jgi:16S rRNA (cytidine1402-2'-O)-methyltransferase
VAGKLFVIATPLGNLQDLSQRALETLREVDLVACEDTRRSSRLLAHYGIRTPLLSCHRFNEHERLAGILDRLRDGDRIALLSDGGTPIVSDPGALLVTAAIEAGLEVSPIPGPSAVTALISVAGFDADRFVFDGFLPHRAGERRRRLRELVVETRTVVVFESPHRIVEALRDVERIFGKRPVTLGRELTKLHESILHGTAGEIAERLGPDVRGEITVAIKGASTADDVAAVDRQAERTLTVWREALEGSGGDRRVALRSAARELGLKKAELQRLLMELGEDG